MAIGEAESSKAGPEDRGVGVKTREAAREGVEPLGKVFVSESDELEGHGGEENE